jgi:hypothetical protein
VTRREELRNEYESFIENLEEKTQLVRSKHGWENITSKIILNEIRSEDVNWIQLRFEVILVEAHGC